MTKLVFAAALLMSMWNSLYASTLPLPPLALPAAMPALSYEAPVRPGSFRLRFDRVALVDLIQLAYTDVLKKSFIIDSTLATRNELVTVSFENRNPETVATVLKSLVAGLGGEVVTRAGTDYYRLKSTADKSEFLPIIYRPVYRNAGYLVDAVTPLVRGDFVGQTRGAPATALRSDSSSNGGESMELASSTMRKTDIVIFNAPKSEHTVFKSLMNELDVPQRQLLVRALVYEVSDVSQSETALGFLLSNPHIGASFGASGLAAGVTLAVSGLNVVANALRSDTRFKLVSSPQVQVDDDGSARFVSGAQIRVETGAVLDKNGNPVATTDEKQVGLVFDVSVDAREKVAAVKLTQSLSNVAGTGSNISVTNRDLSASFTATYGEPVALAGLREHKQSEGHTGLPFFSFTTGKSSNGSSSEYVVILQLDKL